MSEGTLVSLILGVLTLLGGGGIWTYRASRREEPIRREEAALAVAKTSQGMALEIAIALKGTVADLQTEVGKEKDKTQQLVGKVEALTSLVKSQDKNIIRLERSLSIFNHAWDDLIIHWPVIRLREDAPIRPHLEGETNAPPR